MAVDLRDTYIDPARSEYRKMLENLQSNILKPHGRKESDHLLVRFAAGPETVRAWIREFARREVTSARKQLDETGNITITARGVDSSPVSRSPPRATAHWACCPRTSAVP